MTGISLRNKIKIIWKILLLKRNSIDIEIDELIEGYKIVGGIRSGMPCDNYLDTRTGCINEAEHCLSRTYLHIEVKLCTDDHVHICESCTKKILGKTLDFR